MRDESQDINAQRAEKALIEQGTSAEQVRAKGGIILTEENIEASLPYLERHGIGYSYERRVIVETAGSSWVALTPVDGGLSVIGRRYCSETNTRPVACWHVAKTTDAMPGNAVSEVAVKGETEALRGRPLIGGIEGLFTFDD